MTTWAQAARHPWFKSPTMKRRLSANDDDDDDPSLSTLSTSRPKRLRHDSLERTLAHMTLGGALATTSEDVDMALKTSPPPCRMQDNLNVILPSSIEEPGTPVSEPVDMEVEPALVTTGAFAVNDWEGMESGRLDIKEVQISPAVLECLRRQSKCPPPLIPLPCQTSQALVLYRAIRPPSPKLLERPYEDHEETRRQTLVVHGEDDVMEVE